MLPLQVGFVVAQKLLYSFSVHSHLVCAEQSCHTTECNVPHAEENSFFLVVMFTASCVSVLLNAVELLHVLLRARRGQLVSADEEPEVEERRSFLAQLLALWSSHAGLLGTAR